MKHYTGDVFTDHLYPVARSYTKGIFKWHMKKIFDFAPGTIQYHDTHLEQFSILTRTWKKVRCKRCGGLGHF